MSWLCKIGIHQWVDLGQDITLVNLCKQCSRCKLGRYLINFGDAYCDYTPSTMRDAWCAGKIDNPEAREKIYGTQDLNQ